MPSKVCYRRQPGKHLLVASISHFVQVFGPAEATSECLPLEDERTYLWRDLTSDFDPIGDLT